MVDYDNWGKKPGARARARSESLGSESGRYADGFEPTKTEEQIEQVNYDILDKNFPEDGRLVGTDAIFTSCPNVIPHHSSDVAPNPHKRMGIPAPSIYTDDRGEIHNVKANDKRINILYTKAGYLRSGDLHPNEQCDFIFSGKVKIWTLQTDGSTKIVTYGPHEFVTIPRGVPHVFEFVEDTVLAEWWEPPGFQAWFYKPYREIVNSKMGVASSGEGVGHTKRKGLEILVPASTKGWGTAKLIFSAAFIGAIGFAIGRRSSK